MANWQTVSHGHKEQFCEWLHENLKVYWVCREYLVLKKVILSKSFSTLVRFSSILVPAAIETPESKLLNWNSWIETPESKLLNQIQEFQNHARFWVLWFWSNCNFFTVWEDLAILCIWSCEIFFVDWVLGCSYEPIKPLKIFTITSSVCLRTESAILPHVAEAVISLDDVCRFGREFEFGFRRLSVLKQTVWLRRVEIFIYGTKFTYCDDVIWVKKTKNECIDHFSFG